MQGKWFIEVLFANEIQEGDLDVLRAPGPDQPGLARLGRATMGTPDPGAPNSVPLVSWSGGKIGFAAPSDLMEQPYHATYELDQLEQ